VRPSLKTAGGENERLSSASARLWLRFRRRFPTATTSRRAATSPASPLDSVQLILSGTPHIVNVQAVPDVESRPCERSSSLPMRAGLESPCRRAAWSGKGSPGKLSAKLLPRRLWSATARRRRSDVVVSIRDAKLWSPENPFLYELEVDTGADTSVTRFGLRSIALIQTTASHISTGKSISCADRMSAFIDFSTTRSEVRCHGMRRWVRNLHRKFKEMHWNSLRYCIGFPPERWYEIADEEGILIQDEFPVWNQFSPNRWPEAVTVADLVAEYTEWMRERWNHPCVAIWDAQNETSNDSVTGPAIMAARRSRSLTPFVGQWLRRTAAPRRHLPNVIPIDPATSGAPEFCQ